MFEPTSLVTAVSSITFQTAYKCVYTLSYSKYILSHNINFTLFIMGFTIPEIKTPVPPNAGNEIQSFVGMLNFQKIPQKHRIFLI